MDPSAPQPKPRTYTWPRYLLAAVLLGIVLAVLAVFKEARRVQNMERIPLYPGSSVTGKVEQVSP